MLGGERAVRVDACLTGRGLVDERDSVQDDCQ